MPLFTRHPRDRDELPLSRTPEEAQQRIKCFSARARQGQWGLALFGLISLAAFYFTPWLDTIQLSLRETLGPAPPVKLVSIALAVYAFAALIYILARVMEGDLRYRGWSHLGYLVGFYFFYAYGGALRDNFWAILAAGMTILLLEHYRLWSQCQEIIRREKRMMGRDPKLRGNHEDKKE